MKRLSIPGLLLLAVLFFVSCSRKKEAPAPDLSQGTYFSIMDFTRDQWKTYKDQPFVLKKTVTLNGKTDSSTVSALQVSWGQIFKVFFEADISDPKFLDRYDVSLFEESTTQSQTLSYIAKEPGLFTQKLELSADKFNHHIRNIYIETSHNTFWNKQTKKLLYSPLRVIQIQEHNDPFIGSAKDLVIEYKF